MVCTADVYGAIVGWGNEIINTAVTTLINQIQAGKQTDAPIIHVKPKLIVRETS